MSLARTSEVVIEKCDVAFVGCSDQITQPGCVIAAIVAPRAAIDMAENNVALQGVAQPILGHGHAFHPADMIEPHTPRTINNVAMLRTEDPVTRCRVLNKKPFLHKGFKAVKALDFLAHAGVDLDGDVACVPPSLAGKCPGRNKPVPWIADDREARKSKHPGAGHSQQVGKAEMADEASEYGAGNAGAAGARNVDICRTGIAKAVAAPPRTDALKCKLSGMKMRRQSDQALSQMHEFISKFEDVGAAARRPASTCAPVKTYMAINCSMT